MNKISPIARLVEIDALMDMFLTKPLPNINFRSAMHEHLYIFLNVY